MRDILHCDLNNFFASVECKKRPELKKVPMAVAGDPKLRHGIILAKNELAKKYGVVTAETIYSAKKKCPDLVLVEGHYQDYKMYSKLVNDIYLEYTDRVEPFGIDESFLDITNSQKIFGSPVEIANKIRKEVKEKTGLSISVGVSFNKSLAKLGSDLKKPDAVSIIAYENFRQKINFLPVNMLLFVGKRTNEELTKLGIITIGDLAKYNRQKLVIKLGKIGGLIHDYANGLDNDEVNKYEQVYRPKSISSGKTFSKDLEDIISIEDEIRKLVDEVSFKLRKYNMKCQNVSVSIKNDRFIIKSKQKNIEKTNAFDDICTMAIKLFNISYNVNEKVRAITINVSSLVSALDEEQINLFEYADKYKKVDKKQKVLEIMDDIREKYGYDNTKFGSLINYKKNIDK